MFRCSRVAVLNVFGKVFLCFILFTRIVFVCICMYSLLYICDFILDVLQLYTVNCNLVSCFVMYICCLYPFVYKEVLFLKHFRFRYIFVFMFCFLIYFCFKTVLF